MKLFLIRHGETEESKKGILLGHLSGRLTVRGKREMLNVAKKIEKLNPDIIFSSDLKRA
ncbi:MAG: histidine phosphatase family protein [Candidatus Paceibacterota bacterium]|jgi:broad specificity phosphatase PhoE